MYGVLCFVLLFSGVLPALIYDGPCPNVKTIKVINMTALSDTSWYEIARFPDDWERGDCVVLSFDKNGNDIRFSINSVLDSKQKKVEGYFDYDKNTKLSDGIRFMSKSFEGSEGEIVLPIMVLGIDYDKYYIGFDCKYDASKNKRHEYVWITSRTKQLDPKSKTEVDNILKSYEFIDREKLIWDHFTDKTCKVNT